MLKSKRLVTVFVVTVFSLLVSSYGVFAATSSISDDKSESSQVVSEKAHYFLEVNGEYKEVTKAEYEKQPKKYLADVNGELKEISNAEFQRLKKESDEKEKEYLSKKGNSVDGASSNLNNSVQISPMSLIQIANWGFTNKPYNSVIDTSSFNYTAGNSYKRITLNLKQWRSSGSTNNAIALYCIRGRNSNGDLMYYGTDQTVIGYFPDDSTPAKQLYYTMPYSSVNNVFVRISITDSYNVSGYGEAYNY